MSVAASPDLLAIPRRAIFSRKGLRSTSFLRLSTRKRLSAPCLISQSKYLPLNSKSRIRSSCTGMAISPSHGWMMNSRLPSDSSERLNSATRWGTYTSVSSSEHPVRKADTTSVKIPKNKDSLLILILLR